MKKFILTIATILLSTLVLCSCGAAEENNTLSIVDSGWCFEDGYIYYSVKIKNNSETKTYEFPSFRVTAYDENGEVLGSEEQTMSEIKAGETTGYASLGCETSKKPDKVDIEIIEETDKWIYDDEGEHPGLIQMTAKDTKLRKDDMGYPIITGKIVNENEEVVESAAVSVLFKDKDGKLIGGETTFVDGIKAKGETPFELNTMSTFGTDDYEVLVQPW